jgi:penicillin amidase
MRRPLVLFLVAALTAPLVLAAAPAPVRVRGLDGPARIVRDVDGIAHVTAATEHDVWFLQGWLHAQDRLFQMDLLRRQASGTTAELLGEDALAADVELRTLGVRRAAARSHAALSPEARAMLSAYSAGVNRWVADHDLPDEYADLQLTRVRRWTPLDSVAVGKLLTLSLSLDLDDIRRTTVLTAYQEAGAREGFDGGVLFSRDLFPSRPFDPASTVPDATVPLPSAAASRAALAPADAPAAAATAAGLPAPDDRRAATVALAARYAERVADVPLLADALDGPDPAGSNEWAVSGALTASGAPLLANDPHLGLDLPATFYPVHLRGGGIDVSGESFPGTPTIAQGQNARVAWGSTVNPLDVTDVFAEHLVLDLGSPTGLAVRNDGEREPVEAVPQLYRVNRRTPGEVDDLDLVPPSAEVPPVALTLPLRDGGPIVDFDLATGTALSVQWAGFSATRELDAFLAFAKAGDLEDFRAGVQRFDVGSQNFAYADVDGRIAYLPGGELPLREDLEAGTVAGLPPWFVRDGSGAADWAPLTAPEPDQAVPHAILPAGEVPELVDPPAGFFVNANNDPFGTTLDGDPLNTRRPGGGILYFNPGYDIGLRAGRITALLRAAIDAGRPLTAADMVAIQADTVVPDAAVLVPYLRAALERGPAAAAPELRDLAADPRLAEAVGRLAAWDGSTPTGTPEGYDAADVDGVPAGPSAEEAAASVAATIHQVWRGRAVAGIVDAPLVARDLPVPDDQQALSALRQLLASPSGVGASGLDFFAVPGVADAGERRDLLLLRALDETLDLLAGPAFAPAFGGSADQDDYRWGRLHTLTLEHPLGGARDRGPFEVDGGSYVVDASNHDLRGADAEGFTFGSGPNRRAVAELLPDGIRAVSSLPGGTRDDTDLLGRWLTNDTYLVRRTDADIEAAAAEVIELRPLASWRP